MPKWKSKFKEEEQPEVFESPPLVIIPRSEWAAFPPPEGESTLKHPCLKLVVTHTESEKCSDKASCLEMVRHLQIHHRGKGLADIAHNFLIGGDGNVYEGRGWHLRPYYIEQAVDGKDNIEESMQIAFIGAFGDGTVRRRPGLEMCLAFQKLLNYGFENGYFEKGLLPPPEKNLPPPERITDIEYRLYPD